MEKWGGDAYIRRGAINKQKQEQRDRYDLITFSILLNFDEKMVWLLYF